MTNIARRLIITAIATAAAVGIVTAIDVPKLG